MALFQYMTSDFPRTATRVRHNGWQIEARDPLVDEHNRG
ncbi:hypothetical protein LI90_4453 [Carbonactinospora thermoautotrophica]|uniref:Uncharacterized protein n=1 Tax=Carbonactinospora thermoautotrophica TaxID=1469144 RepID=A0A132MHC1_9ACTN|nr:hypothetical protein LI90_4453 [Carbonactinospora thermoautotrophica]